LRAGVLTAGHDDRLTESVLGALARRRFHDDRANDAPKEISIGPRLASARQGFDRLVAHEPIIVLT
jgi:hypothetical protein